MNNQKQTKKPKNENEIRDEYLALQRRLSGSTRRLDVILIAVFLAFIVGFSAFVFLLPDKEFSEQENRYLQTFPSASSDFHGNLWERIMAGKFLDRFFAGKFTEEISDYLSDQFPLRDSFVGLKAGSEIALLKGENNDVLLGKDGYIIKRSDFPNADSLQKNIAALKDFSSAERAKGVEVTTALAGRSIDVLESKLPALFDPTGNRFILGKLESAMGEEPYIDLLLPLKEKADAGEEVYYRTDHHWTTLGAYYAYCEIAPALGIEPFALDSFKRVVASDAFYGTTWSSAGMKWVAPDELHFFRYEGDELFTVTEMEINKAFIEAQKKAENGEVSDVPLESIPYLSEKANGALPSLYDTSYLQKKDKYSAFLGGNKALVRVTWNDTPRETLVIVKDSYAHSLAPFLARHFDLLLVDLRYYTGSVSELIEQEDVKKLLFLYNVANLCDDTSLAAIN
ncbi:MAG: hypothetical protein E7655_06515 [Ruminococcaceae bacterium]|nr:hypothetical protein [Oscillospiraceae bacterium]